MAIEEYLARIDWLRAIVVGGVVVLIAFGVNRFLQATADEIIGAIPFLNSSAANALLRRRHGLPTESWVCSVCRSVNIPTATVCYRGCGPRDEVGPPSTDDGSTSRLAD
jgi:hypothetical protein